MAEKSGLEMLEDLLLEVKQLRKEMKVLDFKVAQIANSAKVGEILDIIQNTKFKDYALPGPKVEPAEANVKPKAQAEAPVKGFKSFKFETSDASKTDQVQPSRGGKTISQATLVSGKMVTHLNNKDVALSGLQVKIYDRKDKLVKQTKTNRAGTWMSHLPPGEYVVSIDGEYKGQDLVPVNLTFEVKKGMKTLEVK